jgi:AmmeMemoRadiSam system protein A
MQDKLTHEEQKILLRLARESVERAVKGEELTVLDLSTLPVRLREQGSSFVTLTSRGQLRGCIGALDAYQSLAEDVREHAAGAALQDPRFSPVSAEELSGLEIEISRLTHPTPLEYTDASDLLAKLRPHVDGVILRVDPRRRATFLPQVWEKIPDPAAFLDNLCYKLGLEPSLWRRQHFDVLTYQVEEFHE